MKFKDTLNKYIEKLDCSAKELSDATGLSQSLISRYRSGKRTPTPGSEHINLLIHGIVQIAMKKELLELSAESVRTDFMQTESKKLDSSTFADKFDSLLRSLNISASDMSRNINYDPSFLSRIRSGSRTPADISTFIQKVSEYFISNYSDEASKGIIAGLIDCNLENLSTPTDYQFQLITWLTDSFASVPNHASDFLHKLDEFDLDDYLRTIHFDELKIPTVPFQIHSSKTYFGVDGQKKAELDFLKCVVLSKSTEPLFMCSDMDMIDMAEDEDFSKKWLFGLACVIKKSQKIIVIHNLNRPYDELMLGLIAYIPLYMTGQVEPYYHKGIHNSIFRHFLNVSGTFALTGEGISDFHEKSKMYLTHSKEEVTYFKDRSQCLLKKALPLMKIFNNKNRINFGTMYKKAMIQEGDRHLISSSLPLFSINTTLLRSILVKNHCTTGEIDIICNKAFEEAATMEQILTKNKVYDEIPEMDREEYEKHPICLPLSTMFFDRTIFCTYEDYITHLMLTKLYSENHPNYKIKLCRMSAFRNIQIHILEGNWVWIAKITAPTIHFVIHHPILRDTIEHMYIPNRYEKRP